MSFFNLYNKAKKNLNKSSFSQKNAISFNAYKILKKFVVNMLSNSQKGILLIILGMSIFSVQDVLVKYLSDIR